MLCALDAHLSQRCRDGRKGLCGMAGKLQRAGSPVAPMAIPTKTEERLVNALKRFQPILASAKARDVGEADTSTIVKDMLCDMFGFDKYSEITAEYAIKSTFCDLAIKLDGKLVVLVEVKAIGTELKDMHAKQAVDYGANQGVEWIVLTNGLVWRIYRIIFGQPIQQELVVEWDFNTISHRNSGHVEALFMLTREGQNKSLLVEYHEQRQAMSRFFLGAMLLSDPIVEVMRRELKRVSPGVRIEAEEIRNALSMEVIKREVLEGDKAIEAKKKINKVQTKFAAAKAEAKAAGKTVTEDDADAAAIAETPPLDSAAA